MHPAFVVKMIRLLCLGVYFFMKKLDLIGKRFKKLLVVSESLVKNNQSFWNCICDCGKSCTVKGSYLVNENTKSCGCLRKDGTSKLIHGVKNNTTEYRTWVNMKTRCYNKKVNDLDYIGRGIEICDRWRYSFKNFYDDMGIKPSPDYSIERLDFNKGYEPSNCIWASLETQVRNKRNNVWYEYDGKKMILQDWANYFGVHQANLIASIKAKGFNNVYLFYYKKYNGLFPNGVKIKPIKSKGYNIPKMVLCIKKSLPIVLESKGIREMSRMTGVHHSSIEGSINNSKWYKEYKFEYI